MRLLPARSALLVLTGLCLLLNKTAIAQVYVPATVQFARRRQFVAAPASGAVSVTIARSGDLSGPVAVTYETIDASAVAGLDYVRTIGTVSWVAGDGTPKSVLVPVSSVESASKDFEVTLLSASGALFGSQLYATALIQASASGTPASPTTGTPTVAFAAPTFNAVAGSGYALVTVDRGGNPGVAVTTTYTTIDGSAVAGTDYVATLGTLSWAAGDSSPKVSLCRSRRGMPAARVSQSPC